MLYQIFFLFLYRKESNALEAATAGASTAIGLVSNIAANLIAFVAFVALIDKLLGWLGSLVDFEQLSFQVRLSYIHWNFALSVLHNTFTS